MLRWNALRDAFSYKLAPDALPCESVTKLQALSEITKLFDPAGWLTPITIKAKIIMQQLWLEGIRWDEKISDLSHEKCITFVDLRLIVHIEIPRWVNYLPNAEIQIHGTCDASERAYCATIYLRSKCDGDTNSQLIIAKSKVAPLQTISLLRLELCAAV